MFQTRLDQKHFKPDVQPVVQQQSKVEKQDVVKVYSTTEYVRQYLKLPNAKFTNSVDSADLIWCSQDFDGYDKLKPNQMINQFRYESCVTYKQRLAQLVQYVSTFVIVWMDWYANKRTFMQGNMGCSSMVASYLQHDHPIDRVCW